MARIKYSDPDCPVEVILEAFSPFIPLNADESSLPATVMSYTLINCSKAKVDCSIRGYVENPVCIDTAKDQKGRRQNRVVKSRKLTSLVCEALPAPISKNTRRKDILFENFESEGYGEWKITGVSFGAGPVLRSDIPDYQGDVGGKGERVVNSHSTAPGGDVGEKDQQTGTLTSPDFKIEREYINFYIGGGANKGKTCINLIVDDEIKVSATGKNNNSMELSGFRTADWEGKEARLEIVDAGVAGWGNIGVDHIVFSDSPPESKPISELRDFGSFCLSVMTNKNVEIYPDVKNTGKKKSVSNHLSDNLTGEILVGATLDPSEERNIDFAFTWHFPNFYGRDFGGVKVGHYYAARFNSAYDVAQYLSENQDKLFGTTRKWVETWYDSSLPYWLLDRSMANTSTLATTTCYRHKDGRFWAWEGIGCCTGTCTHVWHYAQAVGRLFPEIERDQRERVDFGMALKDNGEIGYRALLESSMGPAFDGQCGRIMGAYREHLMSVDSKFLKRNWEAIRKSIQYMIDQDIDLDGILEGAQPNTLDASWYGKISFISSLYISALRAGEKMAIEMGDGAFAKTCSSLAEKGANNIRELYNGEFFIQLEDPDHKDVIGVGTGCYIDQVFGQTWAHWVGLGSIFDRKKQLSALRALWRYNFVPDVGPFRRHFKAGRWYAMAGDGGLLMCTWPKGGKRDKWEDQWQFMYFNECMSGFEYQAASHMVYEGIDNPDILQNGLAVSRAIHDRYNAHLRNPYNEIECSDHYARAMASYGVFQAVCGFNYHGPKGIIEFDPRLTPKDFKAPFICAEGWGSYSQKEDSGKLKYQLEAKYGKLSLNEIGVTVPDGFYLSLLQLKHQDKLVKIRTDKPENGKIRIKFEGIVIKAGEMLSLEIS